MFVCPRFFHRSGLLFLFLLFPCSTILLSPIFRVPLFPNVLRVAKTYFVHINDVPQYYYHLFFRVLLFPCSTMLLSPFFRVPLFPKFQKVPKTQSCSHQHLCHNTTITLFQGPTVSKVPKVAETQPCSTQHLCQIDVLRVMNPTLFNSTPVSNKQAGRIASNSSAITAKNRTACKPPSRKRWGRQEN